MSFSQTTVLITAELDSSSEIAQVIATRNNIIEMTQDAEEAILRPKDFGAFPHSLRAALAARIARLSDDTRLAAQYDAAAADYADLAWPKASGESQELATIINFVDIVANAPRDISADDISTLQNAKVDDADIVRLCELVAFMAYQVRVISGLRLMQGKMA